MVGAEVFPQVVGDALGGSLGQITLQELEKSSQERGPDEPPDREQDDLQPPRRDALVYRHPDELRRGQARRRGQNQRDECPRSLRFVGAQVAERAPHRRKTARRVFVGAALPALLQAC
ncbi:MAG: hypothetical protein M3151_03885 [Actinomycetota bacterium]|nr:hypothetical protein [Actinomycetota bacterium]